MSIQGGRRTIASLACVLISIAAFGCGGGDSDGSEQTEAEARNQAMISQAESEAGSVEEIEDVLRLRLAPYHYAGVEQTFALKDGSLCSIGEVYGSAEDVAVFESDPDTLVSPDGEYAVRISKFQGTERAPCLKAVGDALNWLGEDQPESEPGAELSRTDFVTQADAACRASRKSSDRIFADVGSYTEQAQAISLDRPGFLGHIEELESLLPPAALAADFEEYVTALRDEIEIMDREQAAVAAIGSAEGIGEKPEAADRKSLKRAYREYEENFKTRSALVKTLGFKVCSSG